MKWIMIVLAVAMIAMGVTLFFATQNEEYVAEKMIEVYINATTIGR